jgi:hypothetical protein
VINRGHSYVRPGIWRHEGYRRICRMCGETMRPGDEFTEMPQQGKVYVGFCHLRCAPPEVLATLEEFARRNAAEPH